MVNKTEKIAVVGMGTMGSQIAILSASRGYEVTAFDIDDQSLERAKTNFKRVIKFSEKKPLLSLEEWEKGADEVSCCKELKTVVQDADLVIEAAPENVKLKREIFQTLDKLTPPPMLYLQPIAHPSLFRGLKALPPGRNNA